MTTSHSKVVEENIALVKSIAKKFPRTRTTDVNDYISAGVMGFLKSLESYDPSKGVKVTTYAVRSIRWAIINEYRRAKKYELTKHHLARSILVADDTVLSDFKPRNLSDRESQVFELFILDTPVKEIAEILELSKQTIHLTIRKIKKKIKNAETKNSVS